MSLTTEFAHPRSVEVWDAWYRWREDAVLRDVTVDDTWWRVAKSVAGAEAQQGLLWAHRFVSAFSRWRMLPDERLLRHAGTSTSLESLEAPVAVLNAAAFVRVPMQRYAYFDRDLFLDMAALAVRFLDDAMETFDPSARASGLRVGIIGLVDALHLLRLPCGSAEAVLQVQTIAAALAEGCLRGSVDLAEERGATVHGERLSALLEIWRRRGVPGALIAQAEKYGLRYDALTAFRSYPRLSQMANAMADVTMPMARQGGSPCAPRGVLQAAMQPYLDCPVEGRDEKALSPENVCMSN